MLTVSRPVTNWAGTITFATTRVHRPASVDELRRIVAGARRVRALGTAHSFSPVADTTGELVLLDALPPVVDIDTDARTATVAAGMSYAQVAPELHRAGWALGSMASLPHISVAGSVATGTHGSGDSQRSLAAAVVGLEVVGPEGDLLQVRRGVDDDFAGWVVALGALGVVTRLTLAVEPTYEVSQRVRLGVPMTEVAARPGELLAAAYSVSLFTDWQRETGHAYLKSRDGVPDGAFTLGHEADEHVHPLPGMPATFVTQQLGVPGPWHERLPHFRAEFMPSAGNEIQSEFFLARDQAPAGFAALMGLGERIAPLVHACEVRSIAADDLWLSPAYQRDSVAFHFTWLDDEPALRPVLAEVEQALMPLGARPHWAKLTTVPGAEVAARYERAADFTRLRATHDPDGVFANDFVDGFFPRG
ncbi:FAD-binding protein [Modestobacter sp. I12A-02628]|uniref:FAD-binding protein n=1 Tax=Goekera deserti TaxID=2497753 RepID=A0A7K3WGL4_9ACTN|nr:FAD-binding protein [Goekera deserti]MPQ96592.1 FAD-binding protein [Goekera deserti]NDI47096.1 FAD-binding protein [Goekera deserti]NEL55506.1 FAD-binding protein [Goekera deserti]